MSRFNVLVVGDPEYQLAPFHKFECTGLDDEFVIDVDDTEKTRQFYTTETSTCLRNLTTGAILSAYRDQFYRLPTPEEFAEQGHFGQRDNVRFVPDGWEEAELPASERMSFRDYVEYRHSYKPVVDESPPDLAYAHKYGYYVVDANGEVLRVINRTNPNAKWAWYTVGGRWSDAWLDKNGRFVSSCRKGDLDIEAMQNQRGNEARSKWRKMAEARGPHTEWKTWEEVRKSFDGDIEAARKYYHEQPAIEAMKKVDVWAEYDDFRISEEQYVNYARTQVFQSFAFVQDRQWASNVINEDPNWNEFLWERFNLLPDYAVISLVDCHI